MSYPGESIENILRRQRIATDNYGLPQNNQQQQQPYIQPQQQQPYIQPQQPNQNMFNILDKKEVPWLKQDITSMRNAQASVQLGSEAEFNRIQGEKIHFLWWVSHGINIPGNNTLYPVQTTLASVILNSTPLQVAHLDEYNRYRANPWLALVGACPRPKIIDKFRNEETIYLPPLVFKLYDDPDPVNQYAGLFYYVMKLSDHTGIKTCYYLQAQIVTYQEIMEIQNKNSNKVITYSNMFKIIKDQCTKHALDFTKINLAIFSCQAPEDNNKTKITDLIPRNAATYDYANLLNDRLPLLKKINSEIGFNLIRILPAPLPVIKTPAALNAPLKALNNDLGKGCGLNVLNYYGYYSNEKDAEGEVICLSDKGTSIFKLMDIVDTTCKNTFDNYDKNPNTFIVLRTTIEEGIKLLYNFFNRFVIQTGNTRTPYFLLFKMYHEDFRAGGAKSLMGHTVSIYIDERGYKRFADPQNKIISDITQMNVEQLTNYIKTTYTGFKFMDVIFQVISTPRNVPGQQANYTKLQKEVYDKIGVTVFDENPIANALFHYNEYYTIDDVLKHTDAARDLYNKPIRNNGDWNFVERTNDIIFGGKTMSKRKTMSKSKNMSKRKSKSKNMNKRKSKSKNMNKRKSKTKTKTRKQYGGENENEEVDPYIQLVQEIDAETHIPTVIRIDTFSKPEPISETEQKSEI
jgi:hypothetical protein